MSNAPTPVMAAIVAKGGRVLAARRAPGKHLAGFWEFPGGKLEGSESQKDCLKRELTEEFGVRTSIKGFVAENYHDYGKKVVHLIAYQVEHIDGEFQLRDHDKIAWVEPKELMDLKWAPADIPLVEHYLAITRTARFYNENAKAYCDETFSFDMAASYGPFLDRLPDNGHILDLGCGSGRDTKAFLERGFRVTAIDASPEIAKLAEARTGQAVRVQSFHDLDEKDSFDGVWASASLLHCTPSSLHDAVHRISAALRQHGTLYTSFKTGKGTRVDGNGRFYTDLTESGLADLIAQAPGLKSIEIWTTETTLRGQPQRWANALASKT